MSQSHSFNGHYTPIQLTSSDAADRLEERNSWTMRNELSRTPIEIEARLYSLRICLRTELLRREDLMRRADRSEIERNKQMILHLAGNIEAFEWLFNDEKWIHREFID